MKRVRVPAVISLALGRDFEPRQQRATGHDQTMADSQHAGKLSPRGSLVRQAASDSEQLRGLLDRKRHPLVSDGLGGIHEHQRMSNYPYNSADFCGAINGVVLNTDQRTWSIEPTGRGLAEPVRLHRYFVWSEYIAESNDPPFAVKLAIQVVERTPQVRKVELGPVTGEPSRISLPLRQWARATLPLVAWQSVGVDDSGANVYERPTSERSLWQDVSLAAGRRKRSLPTEDVRSAADAYRKAMAHGDAPVPAVMKKLRLEPSQRGRAERLVARARDVGLLGRTTPGRKGEHTQPL